VDKERFSLLSNGLAIEMSVLSNNAWKLFSLLLQKIVRKKKTREPTRRSNPFRLTYQDFKKYGIASTSFKSGIIELEEKGFIQISGEYNQKKCKVLKWD
jgi:hypothetical protein